MDVGQIVARLAPAVAPAVVDEITARAAGRQIVPIEELHTASFPILFDFAALQLRVDIPVDARALNPISITNRDRRGDASLARRATSSFGTKLHLRRPGSIDRQLQRHRPRSVQFRGAGLRQCRRQERVYLTFLTGLQEVGKFFRRRTTLFHDDTQTRSATRSATSTRSARDRSAPAEPDRHRGRAALPDHPAYRNLRPAGRGGLTLERPSRVEIYVNGAIYRTISFGAGRYDLRDFPFLDGLNDVRLIVRDDTGRNETIGLSFFPDTELLESGLSTLRDVRLPAGPVRAIRQHAICRIADLQRSLSARRRRLADVGRNLQVDRSNGLLTALAAIGTPIGLFGVEGALGRNDHEKLQGAMLISYACLAGQGHREVTDAFHSAGPALRDRGDLHRAGTRERRHSEHRRDRPDILRDRRPDRAASADGGSRSACGAAATPRMISSSPAISPPRSAT